MPVQPMQTVIKTAFFNPINNYFKFIFVLIFCVAGLSSAYGQINKADSLSNLIKQHPAEDDRKATLLFELSRQSLFTDPKKGLTYLDQLIAFHGKIKTKTIVASAYRLKGVIQYLLTMFPEALASLNEAYRIDKLSKSLTGVAGDRANMGMVYLAQSNLPGALASYQEAAKVYENAKGFDNDATSVYANIGIIYMQMNNYDKATAHFIKAREIYKRLNNTVGEANAIGNMAVIASKKKDYGKAIAYSRMSLKLNVEAGNKAGIARETGNLAGYYIPSGKYDEGIEYGLKATQLNKAIGNTKGIGYNKVNIAEAYLKKDNYKDAKTYGLTALKIGNDLKLLEIQRDASEGLSQIYDKLQMADSSLYYVKRFVVLKDSISNDQKRQEITRMGIQYDFDKKEITYQQRQQLSNEKLKQQQLQLALNNVQLQRSTQQAALKEIQLQNEKLRTREKQKQLILSVNKGKLQASRVKALSQQQQLNKLRMNQLWLYGVLLFVVLLSVLLYFINLYRIRRLRFNSTLQMQQAALQAQEIGYRNKLAESELRAIRAQMNPHFIFNVLNSIESYVLENDSRTASRLVQKFATLSRLILENSTQSMVTADREWKALKLYTELEAMRFNNQFAYSFYADADKPGRYRINGTDGLFVRYILPN
ncbi:MAG: tetratricopeptide repeat protein, partial [Sphingobacteriaceae bacterium]